jgi:hypothetical protein
MKINGPSGVGSPGVSQSRSAQAADGFSIGVAAAEEVATGARAAGVVGIGSIDALLALQQVEDRPERRRKAVRRAGVILDVLDEIKLALLDGGVPAASLRRLVAAVRLERGGADELRLQALLDEIETRAAVELAKLELASAA